MVVYRPQKIKLKCFSYSNLFKIIPTDTTMNSNKAINEEMVTDFIKLFGKDNVYFRDDKRDNGITERFNKNNTEIICLVCCEGGTEEHLDYYVNGTGSGKLAKLIYKYMIDFEWEDNCVASFHHMEEEEKIETLFLL